ncbi:MAG: haloacid dehalogenase type II [Minwuia sp.]|uniref:haloacid dehalogenase type II n=1 Tax=Minwuia sp. TaxID=2493630 RepID=UPI003A8B08F2
MSRKPRALLFDVFGTVVDWRRSIAREVDRMAAERGWSIDGNDFAISWRKLYQPAMERIRAGNRGFVKLDVLHRENLDQVLSDLGVDGLSEAEKQDLNLAWHRLAPWPDSVGGLNRMKSRHILATCSNGNIALMVNMAKNAGLPWDVILGAEVTQAYKPMQECYLGSATALGLDPGECCMVAAHNDDLAAAKSFGLMTAYVERPLEFKDDGGPYPATGDWNYVAADFIDLAAQLDA